MNERILPLAACRDVSMVGGKAACLGELLRAGFDVPDGFVITTAAWRDVVGGESSDDRAGDTEALFADVLAHYEQLGGVAVAVRSSGTIEDSAATSMAGQYDTFLDVHSSEALVDCVRRCWAGVESSRSTAYLEKRIDHVPRAAMAVIVQRMIPAEIAGVLFTADPRSGDECKFVVEATRGLGDQVVSGTVQPDTLTLASGDGQVLDSRIETGCLDSQAVLKLWQLGKRIEVYFGRPQDIEWAMVGGRLYVLQARPITQAGSTADLGQVTIIRMQLAHELRFGNGPWVRHNIGQTLGCPTPLTWGITRPFLGADGGMGTVYRRVGFDPVGNPATLIGGQIYTDLALSPQMFFKDFPFTYDLESLRGNLDAGQAAPTSPRGSVRQRLITSRKLAAVEERITELARSLDHELEASIFPAFAEWIRIERAASLESFENDALIDRWENCRRHVLDEFAPMSLLPGLILGQAQAALVKLLDEHLCDVDAAALARSLVAGRPDQTVVANHELYEAGHGRRSLDDWLAKYGHRGPDEMDLASARWRERLEEVHRLTQRLAGGFDPMAQHAARREAARAAVDRTRLSLPRRARPQFDANLRVLERYLPFREDGKYHLMLGYELLRLTALQMGRRLRIEADVFYLTPDELLASMRGAVIPLAAIARRKWRWEQQRKLSLPELIDREWIVHDDVAAALPSLANQVQGFAISGGVGEGEAYVAEDPTDPNIPSAGYVLVCRTTDPAWTPLFVNAKGLIVETGGVFSHGAIVAREMGVPAVVIPDARRLFATGSRVQVDGDRGIVRPGNGTGVAASTRPQADAAVMPPPVGAKERSVGRWRNRLTIGWIVVLALALLLPPAWLYDSVMRLFDLALWPLVSHVGPLVATVILAGGLAAFTMLLQWVLTDNRRLVIAKARAGELRRLQRSREKIGTKNRQWSSAIAFVQIRLLGAAMVPVGLLLGPMVFLFLWLPVRVDPAVRPPAGKARIVITASINGDWTAPVSLAGDSIMIEPSAAQAVPPIRSILTQMRQEWLEPGNVSLLPPALEAIGRASHGSLLESLDGYLAKPIPPQPLAWVVTVPDLPGIHTLRLTTAGAMPAMELRVANGEQTVPQPTSWQGRDTAIQSVRVDYPPKLKRDRIFFRPFAYFGWDWDAGWAGVYIAVYLPAMYLVRALLRLA